MISLIKTREQHIDAHRGISNYCASMEQQQQQQMFCQLLLHFRLSQLKWAASVCQWKQNNWKNEIVEGNGGWKVATIPFIEKKDQKNQQIFCSCFSHILKLV